MKQQNSPSKQTTFAASFLLLVLLGTACSVPEPAAVEPELAGTEVLTPEGESLGRVHFPTSCDSAVQTELEVGLALLHHMNYTKAKPVFESAITTDPECAIARWGVAMTYVHPLWPDLISAAALTAGSQELAAAEASSHTSPREAAYVAALAAYYEGGERTEKARLGGFLDGWKSASSAFPEDNEAAAFYALSLLGAAAPEDKTYSNQYEAAGILKEVLAAIPMHPGAHHYAIHAHDFPPLAQDALDIARRYDDLSPENTHALHMTSHIFTRLGLWPESIEFNVRAAAASLERTPAGAVSLHHLHALDYLAYAHLQRADEAAALEVVEAIEALQPPFQDHPATAYTFAALPVRLVLERHDWEGAAAIKVGQPEELQWEKYPYLAAISQFARALGAARSGQSDLASEAIVELVRLEEASAALNSAYDWGIQVRIQRTAAEAWLAYESGDVEEALKLAESAAQMEGTTEKNPVTPGEVLPARELYGDMLLAAGQYGEALAAYQAALNRSPNRFNSVYGAARAAEALGDAETARSFYSQLLELSTESGGEHPELDHARQFVSAAAEA